MGKKNSKEEDYIPIDLSSMTKEQRQYFLEEVRHKTGSPNKPSKAGQIFGQIFSIFAKPWQSISGAGADVADTTKDLSSFITYVPEILLVGGLALGGIIIYKGVSVVGTAKHLKSRIY